MPRAGRCSEGIIRTLPYGPHNSAHQNEHFESAMWLRQARVAISFGRPWDTWLSTLAARRVLQHPASSCGSGPIHEQGAELKLQSKSMWRREKLLSGVRFARVGIV